MTTIAANKDMMAADTLCDTSGIKTFCHKIFDKNGHIIGTAGDSQDGMLFINWYNSGEDRPDDVFEDFEALVLTPKGDLFWYGRRFLPEPVHENYFAIGAGAHVAMKALKDGATPAEAVYCACDMTLGSDHPIEILRRK